LAEKINVGIDLGTTNSALAWIDPVDAAEADFPPIQTLDIPQTVAPGRTETRRTLPSFVYLDDPVVVGAYAREQGALVPTKSVYAAKSWLSNPEVPRKRDAFYRPLQRLRAISLICATPGTRRIPSSRWSSSPLC
jgi:molecular chaperone DnaK (HSP70)